MCKIKSEDESYIDKIIEIVGIENDKETKGNNRKNCQNK